MDISNVSIGKRIREVRKERGYTREQLAEYADISTDFISVVEVGKKGMKVQNLAKIALALNVTTDYLIFGTTPCEENAEINTMLSAMSDEKKKQVEKLITVFVDTIRVCEKENENKSQNEI